MKPKNRWRATSRVLGAGAALVLLLGASGEGCGGSSGGDEATCPRAEAAAAAVAARAEVSLPYGDEAEDLERAHDIAQRVADATDGKECVLTENEGGYKVTIPFKKGRPILVRVMARSRERENYYRVSVANKSSVDSDGKYSDKPEDTHHELPDDDDDAVDEIVDLVHKTEERYK